MSGGELLVSMRREQELLSQLGFLLGPPLRDLVAEHPQPDRQPVEPVLQSVDGQRLGSTATADHRVDPGPGPGHEPEAAIHAAVPSASRAWRLADGPPTRGVPPAARCGAACASA